MKKIRGSVLFFALLVACMTGLMQVADANFIGALGGLPVITIQRDGSVVPQTKYIKQNGDVYSLTADLQQKYVININCSNIVLDGQGHIINGSGNVFWPNEWHGYNCEGITLIEQTNVTIKNLIVSGFEQPAIYVYNCSNLYILGVQSDLVRLACSKNNTVLGSKTPLDLILSDNNYISENTLWLGLSESNNSLIYYNNISSAFLDGHSANVWDNGSMGNFWADYLEKYPDASEIDDMGTWDTPYVKDAGSIDNHPLINLCIAEKEFPMQASQKTEPFLNVIIAAVAIIATLGVAIGLLNYLKNTARKTTNNRVT